MAGMAMAPQWLLDSLLFLAALFIFIVGLGALALVVLFVIDITQTKHAIRRNYPVIGRMRYLLEHLGTFLRQYMFAMDWEEQPFNRAQRSYVYQAAKKLPTTRPFGSTRNIRVAGSVLFVNGAYPTLDRDAVEPSAITFGADSARRPYETRALVNASAMSYGALSRPAVQALARGCAKAGVWINTGEGGLAPYHLEGGGPVVFQIGTAKYGVRTRDGRLDPELLKKVAAHEQVRMIELKLSQGAKPGKGGILPAAKVTEEIARIRGIEPHSDSISPNRHPEIENADDLIDMINRIRDISGLPTGFKCVIGDYAWLIEVLERITKRGPELAPDFITIDSCDGGTGAAPASLLDYVGLPIQETLPRVVDLVAGHGLKSRIRILASGKMITPADVAWALCAGADSVNIARGLMFALGCIQAMKCHTNRCPTGVTTHDPRLQRGLVVADKAERVANYIRHLEHEVGVIAHSCGVKEPRELTRRHVRIVCPDTRTIGLDELYPDVEPGAFLSVPPDELKRRAACAPRPLAALTGGAGG
ncbi:MAG: FMN-binding glutamate synthase family protein [Rhodothalassiaceae bacterium]|nr:MAG: FMN-binding glutamate synthase family protein [Rhodothalassiaceae bacterium]